MNTTIISKVSHAAIAAMIGIGGVCLVGCYDTYTPAPVAPVAVVHEPTALTTVPPTADSTTVTTQYGNGVVDKRTTTTYNPGYTAYGPPYKTTVVPAVRGPATSTTSTTTVSDY